MTRAAAASGGARWRIDRALFVLLHRWVGLVLAGFLLLAGVTGALLAWYDELDAAISPALLRAPPPTPDARPLDPLVLFERTQAAYPHAVLRFARLSVRPGHALVFSLSAPRAAGGATATKLPNNQVFVDPYTGRVLGERYAGDLSQGLKNLMPFVYRLHYQLALGVVGSYAFGVVALLWALDCFVGAYLTFPASRRNKPAQPGARSWPARWWTVWKVRWHGGGYRLNLDLHRAGGLWVWAMLFVLAWSGVAFNLREVYDPAMKAVFAHQADDSALPARCRSRARDRLARGARDRAPADGRTGPRARFRRARGRHADVRCAHRHLPLRRQQQPRHRPSLGQHPARVRRRHGRVQGPVATDRRGQRRHHHHLADRPAHGGMGRAADANFRLRHGAGGGDVVGHGRGHLVEEALGATTRGGAHRPAMKRMARKAALAAAVATGLSALSAMSSALASTPPASASLPALSRLSVADAVPIDGFVQVAPAAGSAPTRRTALRMAHDGKTLHIRVHAFDPEPSAIVARQMRRDVEGMLTEDQVTLVFDPDGDGRHGYLFAVNANGAQFDALVFDGGQMRHDWDALWQSSAHVGADGWHAEIAIPLSVFGRGRGHGPAGDKGGPRMWRMNAERSLPRGSERVRLAGLQPDKEVYSLGDALPLPAITADPQGWGLRAKASLRATGESAAAAGTGRARYGVAPGLELFHESAAGLRSAAALNIDFGEAEADERTVNLTRFELFRPEKREFFLRDAGRFTFGGLVESAVIPYYSRRIGLDATGRGRSLDAGLKLSGQLAGTDFGLFGARVAGGPTAPGLPGQPAADAAVLRVARALDGQSRIGWMGTWGNPEGTSGSSLWGVDYQYRNTRWAPPGGAADKTLEAHAWTQASTNAGLGNGRAWGASVDYPNIGLTGNAQVQQIDARFKPALGYLAEAGVTRGEGELGWWHRTRGGDDIVPGIDWSARRKHDGSERSWLLNPEVRYTNAAGDNVMLEMFFERDRLASVYSPVPGLAIQPGSYGWHYLFGLAETSPSRPVSVSAEWRSGGYYDGRRDDQLLQLAWKPSPRWGWRVGAGRNGIRLPSGRFTVRTASLRLEHTPDARLSQDLLLQWDNVTGALGASARVRWQWAPGRELIFSLDRLGYTGLQRHAEPGQTRAMLKLVWQLAR
jgi:uncharacterized iron-regulated membrane protein